jgi:hypothetical protein
VNGWSSVRPVLFALLFSCPGLLCADPALAGGPLAVSKSGEPYAWDNSGPIAYHPDRGPLGLLDNEAALELIEESFGVWSSNSLSSVSLSFENGGLLPKDVNSLSKYLDYEGYNNGINAIIFDSDGSILAELGLPPEVVGFAGPEVVRIEPPYHILEGIALLNGAFIDGDTTNGELTREEYEIVFRHEFGHLLNLDHTQINGQYFLGDTDDPGFAAYGPPPHGSVQLMFPFFFEGFPGSSEPLSDDIAAVSRLYPVSPVIPAGSATGQVFESDGTTPFQGANVIARNPDDPFFDVVSGLSGSRYCPDCPGIGLTPPFLKGFYELIGLKSGSFYTVEVVNVNPELMNGSSIGFLPTPRILCGPEEFYDENESADAAEDDPMNFGLLDGGVNNTDVHLILNDGGGEAVITPASHDFGSVAIGDGAAQAFTIENTGTGTLSGQASVAPPFGILSGSSYAIEPGGSHVVLVGFTPVSGGLVADLVAFSCSGKTATVSGVGTGGSSGKDSDEEGCFIATAAYGSPLEDRVDLLRNFRDRVLLHVPLGKEAVSLYYTLSPPAADVIANNEALRLLSRWVLLPVLSLAWISLEAGPLQQVVLLAGSVLVLLCCRSSRRCAGYGSDRGFRD